MLLVGDACLPRALSYAACSARWPQLLRTVAQRCCSLETLNLSWNKAVDDSALDILNQLTTGNLAQLSLKVSCLRLPELCPRAD
jgi:hypothetical protein